MTFDQYNHYELNRNYSRSVKLDFHTYILNATPIDYKLDAKCNQEYGILAAARKARAQKEFESWFKSPEAHQSPSFDPRTAGPSPFEDMLNCIRYNKLTNRIRYYNSWISRLAGLLMRNTFIFVLCSYVLISVLHGLIGGMSTAPMRDVLIAGDDLPHWMLREWKLDGSNAHTDDRIPPKTKSRSRSAEPGTITTTWSVDAQGSWSVWGTPLIDRHTSGTKATYGGDEEDLEAFLATWSFEDWRTLPRFDNQRADPTAAHASPTDTGTMTASMSTPSPKMAKYTTFSISNGRRFILSSLRLDWCSQCRQWHAWVTNTPTSERDARSS